MNMFKQWQIHTRFCLKNLAALSVLTVIAACTPRIVVNVNAITDPTLPETGKRYVLTAAIDKLSGNNLYFQEFSRYFHHILKKQGYVHVGSRDNADIEIKFHFGISDGRTGIQSYSWPIYETFGGESVTVTERITDSSGQTRTVQRTVYIPTYVRQVGSTYETRSYTIFNRYVNLAAFPIKTGDTKSQTPLWNVNIHSVGESNDLRAIMPYLAVASMPFLGKNSGQQQSITINENDSLLMELRGLVIEQNQPQE